VKILAKFGGTLLDDAATRAGLCGELAGLCGAQSGAQWTLVHGGGKQMTKYLAERGVESRFVEGLRVTTPEVLDAILKVFAGTVNKQFVGSLVEAGLGAVGLTGIDAGLAVAETMDERLGAVGRIVESDPRVLEALCGAGLLPVVACVAGGRGGKVYNVNADQMAVACAAAWGADRLLFLTDVDGVRGADGEQVAVLTTAGARGLIEAGVATGGMQAKLNAAIAALEAGVGEVRIVRGSTPGILGAVLSGSDAGTRMVGE
jgi:acetylglutamate kinase